MQKGWEFGNNSASEKYQPKVLLEVEILHLAGFAALAELGDPAGRMERSVDFRPERPIFTARIHFKHYLNCRQGDEIVKFPFERS